MTDVVGELLLPNEETEKNQFCTVASEIELMDGHGGLVTRFARICIQFEETYREDAGGSRYAVIHSRLTAVAKHNVADDEFVLPGHWVNFYQRFMQRDNPEIPFLEFHLGGLTRGCRQGEIYTVTNVYVSSAPSILEHVANVGWLKTTHVINGPRC